MNFDKAYDLLDGIRERLETTIPNSSVDLMPSDTDDFFITVTQRNETTGNESKWSFCVDFGTNKVQMLEPVEDEESFRNGNEVFSIIKNFLNGGMSREKRFGNKIGSSNKTVIRQGPNLKTLDETPAEHIMKNLDAYKGYTRYDMEQLVLNPSGYTLYNGNNRKAIYKKDGATKDDDSIVLYFRNGELKNAEIKSSRKSIKSSLSDVNKALGFTDKDIEEDGRIHITTDFGEFVVDYVNDEYVVSYDGEERIFTEYKDTVEEVVDLFNKLCNEEVEFFDKNINSSKSIKSSKYIVEVGNDEIKFDNIEEANETFRQAVENNDINTSIKIYVDEGYSNKHLKLMRSERGRLTSSRKSIKSSYEYARQYGWDFVDWIAHGDMNFDFDSLSNERIDEMYDEFLDIKNQPLYDINSSKKPIKSDWNRVDKKTLVNPEYPEYKIVKHEWVNFRATAYEWVIYENNKPLYWKKVRGQDRYITIPEQEYNYNTASGFKSLQKAISVANEYIQNEKEETIQSSRKPIKSDYSDEEYWYPETKKIYRLYKYDSNGNYYTWDYDTLEEAQRMKPRGNRYTSYNIKEVEVPVQSSRKPIKSDFNPYYEKHPDTPVGYLLGGPADTVTDADKKAADEYGLFYEGYGTMDGTEKGHLFIGEYQKLKSYFEDYMGHSLADDYIYPYEDSFGEHILDRFEIEMTWVLPTEKDYQDIVNKLNEYVDKEYGREFGTGSIYHFNMYKGEGTNTDGYGHEYPNYIIFDTEGNLDLFSGDEIVQYIDNLLDEKGWYKEPVSGSDNFTIAIK